MKYALLISTSLLAAVLAAPSFAMTAPSQALAAAAVAPVDELVVTAVRTPDCGPTASASRSR
jgi:hypothetical protein